MRVFNVLLSEVRGYANRLNQGFGFFQMKNKIFGIGKRTASR